MAVREAGAAFPLASSPVLADADFARLSRFIEGELGIRMPETKRVMLESRLQKRLRQLGIKDFDSYVDYIFSERGRDAELANMIDAVTTNKTDFFREAEHFDYLVQRILPEASRRDGPYTLAMVLEERRAVDPAFSYRIFASDLSSRVLQKARDAVYESDHTAVVPLGYKKKYMLRSKDPASSLVRMKPEIRAKVEFARINFMDDRYPIRDRFDAIFCRNVIIYFERSVQELILRRLISHLREGGWLVLGHSETLTGMDMPVRGVAPTIYVRE
jgi:chemotaxis protein methyltransferase CheR